MPAMAKALPVIQRDAGGVLVFANWALRGKSALAGLCALAVVLPGALPGQSTVGCIETYNNYLEDLKRRKISPEQRMALHRWARRAYNACETGDVPDVEGLFERLERQQF
jgi:hypothetical protein